MTSDKRNVPESIRARLLNLSRDRHEDFNLTLSRYVAERFLYTAAHLVILSVPGYQNLVVFAKTRTAYRTVPRLIDRTLERTTNSGVHNGEYRYSQ